MLSFELLDYQISEYYDDEMNVSELLDFEARIAISRSIKNYSDQLCFEFFKISNSIKLVKQRIDQSQKELVPDTVVDNKRNVLFYINTVLFQGFYKHLRNFILNIKRNNSK